jgi:dihydrolipoamide dehydrogenase
VADAFDLIVLGGGTGGYAAAIRAASLGQKVALIERDKLGGTCLHRGCIPTKALLHSAEIFDEVREGKKFGINAEASFDWDGVQSFKTSVVDQMHKGLGGLLKGRKIEVINGSGAITSATTATVDGRELTAKNIVVATGSSPKMIPGLERGERVITSDEALSVGVPKSAIVLGGGAIGVEFASVWASFGAQVTVVEMLPNLVPLEDADLGKELAKQFKKRGITSMTGAKMEEAKVTDHGVTAQISTDGKTDTVEAEVLLVAVGRGPVTTGLEKSGITLDQRGFVSVDQNLQTSVPGIYAVGDCIPTPALAHVSFAEGIYVAELLAGLNPIPINYDAVPRATYCTPEVAAVGLTESQARERGHDVVTNKVALGHIGKAVILGTSGFCKLVAAKDGALLGAHFIGARVTELVAEAMLAVGWEAMPSEIAQFIHPHPTLTESMGEAALALAGRPLHTL